LDGRLKKATRLKGIEGFRAGDNGLVPVEVDTWGQLVFVRMDCHQAGIQGAGIAKDLMPTPRPSPVPSP